jgi:uncharacterized membrane protein YphA (DoxX/SURF4 family)
MRFNRTLWAIQVVLALLFVFAGGMKLVMPIEAMQQGPVVFPGAFLRFIGVVELLGGLGLILPGAFWIRTGLTPLAAAGLFIIMLGATVITAATAPVSQAIVPFVTGILAALVAYGRWRVAPNPSGSRNLDRTVAAS